MKKLLVFLITIFTFNLLNVNALDISIDSVKVKEKSNNLEVGDVNVEGLTISPSINFKEVGEFVTYEIKLKKDKKDNYIIKNIVDDNFNKGLVTSYEYSKDLSKPILLTIKYEEKGQSLDKVNINIEIEEVSNPKTGIALFFIFGSIILVWTYAIIDSKKQKQVNIKVFLLGLLLLPLTSVLAAEKVTLVLKGEGITLPASIDYLNRQVEGAITPGDELAIKDEHFYVVSSNKEETVLLSKYNLYVGDIYDVDTSTWKYTYQRRIASTEEGYGMQNETAKAGLMDDSHWIGTVPFSGNNYWWDAANDNFYEKYGLYDDTNTWKNNNIYDSTYQEDMPELSFNSNGFGYIAEENYNNYSVAKYVEEYITKLKEIGAPSNITGRLLTYNEVSTLGCDSNNYSCENAPTWVYETSYWLGSASFTYNVWGVSSSGYFGNDGFYYDNYIGVRPVVVVSTSDI